jgi:apolipoprotein D and lipocalin family protein
MKSMKIYMFIPMRILKSIPILMLLFSIWGCTTGPPIYTVDSVDIERFMGDWYVIANIPTAIEKEAYNAIESYRLAEDGTIETTFTFNKGGFDGPLRTYKPLGFIEDKQSNAVWGMQFFWPIKAEYRIIYLTEDYTQTVIGRTKRDYVWIMARKPEIPEDDYNRILDFLQAQGYDLTKLQKVPQKAK